MKQKITVAFCISLTVIGTVIFAKNSETWTDLYKSSISADSSPMQKNKSGVVQQANTPVVALSDEVVFDMIFNLVNSLDEAAAKLESQGKSGNIWHNYFEREAGLSAQEVATLHQVANDFAREVTPIHRRAMQIINEQRISGANSRKPFPLPPELDILQKQREAIALQKSRRLQSLLSPEVIDRLRRIVEQNNNNLHPLTAGEQELFSERAKHFRNNTNQSSKNTSREESSNE